MPSPLASVRSWLSSVFYLAGGWLGAYPSTDPRRLLIDRTQWRPRTATADQALVPSLTQLVADCRDLDRRSPLVRSGVEGMRAELIGTGIAGQPNTGDPALDRALADLFSEWCCTALVSGGSLYHWQWTAAGEFVTSGAVLARWVVDPTRLTTLGLPAAQLLPLEVEWFSAVPLGPIPDGHTFTAGIQCDRMCRPVAYHLADPHQMGTGEVVPAADIIHAFLPRRFRSVRGEPLAAPLVERALNDDEIVLNELAAGRNAAQNSGFITSKSGADEDPAVIATRLNSVEAAIAAAEKAQSFSTNGRSVTLASLDSLYRQRELLIAKSRSAVDAQTSLPPGTFRRLLEGEAATIIENKRPSAAVSDFRATIRGDVASVLGLPRYWFDHDASQANYSSQREAAMKAKRRLAPLQDLVGHHLASGVYRRVLPDLLLLLGVTLPTDPAERRRLTRHTLRPDVAEYIDPQKDADAVITAVSANLMTMEEACASRGRNFDDIAIRRAAEVARLRELGLEGPVHKPTPPPVPGT